MQRNLKNTIKSFSFIAGLCLALAIRAAATETPAPPLQLVISVQDQRMLVVRDGEWVAKFPVSTSRFGTGDSFGSYRTPLGELKVCDKIGQDLSPGAVIRHRNATGEVLPVNAPGRDPIVTRLIWLEGLEPQNKNARVRGIYIHGTPEERTIGTPVSWGCIRMRSKDVIKVFNAVPVGTVVSIIPSKLPHLHRYQPPKQQPAPPPVTGKPAQPAAAPPASPVATRPAETPVKAAAKPASAPSPATNPPPPQTTTPETGTASAWRAFKGSFLLANLPMFDAGKADDRHKKTTQ